MPRDPRAARPWRNIYGRRKGKGLRPHRQELLETRLAGLAAGPVSPEENPERRPLDLAALFPRAGEVWLEIGFGGGEHMVGMAVRHPEIGMLGCEYFIDGIAKLIAQIERAGLGNIRLHPGDCRDLIDVLPDASIGQVFLLYPDPWPKRRHHKRRFISSANMDALARVMAPGAVLRLATDIGDYARHALEVIAPDPRFEWLAERPQDWRAPWDGWPGTRYEAKALREGRIPCYLSFRRL